MRYFTWKLEFFSNILSVFVADNENSPTFVPGQPSASTKDENEISDVVLNDITRI